MTVDGRRSIARLVPHPGQKTSSQGVPAISAARIVGDHNMSRPVAKRRFHRSMTSSASRRAARSAFSLAAPAWMSSPRVLTPIAVVSGRQLEKSIRLLLSRFRRTFAGGAGCGLVLSYL
jgi:hypothetical protein